MTTPKVSIIIAVYNLEKYLATALDSVIQQTLSSLEIILVDDASTDNSEQIILDYQKKDDRIVYIKHKENKGSGEARNTGLSIARGEYIGFPDGDDWCNKHMYQTMYQKAKQYEADLVQCEIKNTWIHDKSSEHFLSNGRETLLEGSKTAAKHFINRLEECILSPNCANKIFKRELFRKLRFTNAIVASDMEMMSKIVFEGKRFLLLDQAFYYYFQRPDSLSHKKISLEIVRSYANAVRTVINLYKAYDVSYDHLVKQFSLFFTARLLKLPKKERKQFQPILIEQTSLDKVELQRLIREKLFTGKIKQFIRFLLRLIYLEDLVVMKVERLRNS